MAAGLHDPRPRKSKRMLELLMYSFLIAVTAHVFHFELLDGVFCWYSKLLDKLPEWISDQLGGCDACLGGQLALWFYVYVAEYNLIHHIFFICLTIFFIRCLRLI